MGFFLFSVKGIVACGCVCSSSCIGKRVKIVCGGSVIVGKHGLNEISYTVYLTVQACVIRAVRIDRNCSAAHSSSAVVIGAYLIGVTVARTARGALINLVITRELYLGIS